MEIMRLEARIDELYRRQVAFEDRIVQLFSRRDLALGEYRPVRLARTVAVPDPEDAYAAGSYPAENSRANVFPIVFLDGGFVHEAGLQNTSFTNRAVEPQAYVCALGGQYLPEGSILQVWQDRGTDEYYPGEWWTIHRPCLPSKVLTDVKISGSQLVKYVWYTAQPCDYTPAYTIADLSDCYVPYSPYAPGGMLHYFDDGFVLGDHPEWSISEEWDLGFGGYDDDTCLTYAAAGNPSPAVLTVTIGELGGFVQIRFQTAGSIGALFAIDGDEILGGVSTGPGEWIAIGPIELEPGTHTLSFDVLGTEGSVSFDDITIWGAE